MLVNGMGCYFPGWDVNIWDRVLVKGLSASIWDTVLVYRLGC